MALVATFKVHKVDAKFENGGPVEKVTMHYLDPQEPGVNALVKEARSGNSRVSFVVDAVTAVGVFKVGQFVQVTFEPLGPEPAKPAG